nr:unnamed protein product [Spirometra erinaceieuropaei]
MDIDEAGSPAGTTDEIIENIDFTEEDARKDLLALKEGKSPGPDLIPAKVLKELACKLAKPLWRISRSSFDRGILPSDWKVANIYPINKGGSRTSTNDYRPEFDDYISKEVTMVVMFFAKWCRACKALLPALERMEQEHPGVLFLKIDTVQFEDLTAKPGVRPCPAFLVCAVAESRSMHPLRTVFA